MLQNRLEGIVLKQDTFLFHAGFMKPTEKHDFSDN